MNAYDLSSGEEAEEEEMENDETVPAATVTSTNGPQEATGATATRSDSNTRKYMESLPGSPRSEPPELPVIGVDWNDMDVIMENLPTGQRERARCVQEVGLFCHQLLKEYLQIHLMTIFPGQPDLMWDHGAWWSPHERRNFNTFCEIVVHGMYQHNWGSFVEQWFIHEDHMSSIPDGMAWNSE